MLLHLLNVFLQDHMLPFSIAFHVVHVFVEGESWVCVCGCFVSNLFSCLLRTALLERPDVVVGTPAKVLTHVQQKVRFCLARHEGKKLPKCPSLLLSPLPQNLLLRDSLEQLVMDEADLLFSYGYEDNIRALLLHLPPIYQTTLLSATLSEVDQLA